jgi:hypothetical protein
MSTILSILLLTALPDLSSKDFISADDKLFISLRPVESDAAGTVWILSKSKHWVAAGHGRYSVFQNDGHRPRLRLLVSQTWYHHPERQSPFTWLFSSNYYADIKGIRTVDLEIDSDKNDLILTAMEFGRCNSKAEWLTEAEADGNGFFTLGEISRFRPTEDDQLADMQLPRYVSRAAWTKRSKTHPQKTFNTDALDSDWYGWSGQNFYLFSFIPSDAEWERGEAWLIWIRESTIRGSNDRLFVTVARGRYEIRSLLPAALETNALTFVAQKIYTGTAEGNDPLKWHVMLPKEFADFPAHLEFSVPLTDRAFNKDLQPLILEDASYLDTEGKKTIRTSSEGFLGSRTKIDNPTDAFGAEEQSAILFAIGSMRSITSQTEFEEKVLELLKASPPPGVDLRSFGFTQTVARPKSQVQPNYKDQLEKAEKRLRENPQDAGAGNDLAWILCTAPEKSLRNGKRAVQLATQVCQATKFEQPMYIDTLAAAYAEIHQFKYAVNWQLRAIEIAKKDDRLDYQSRLDLYRKSRAYHKQ